MAPHREPAVDGMTGIPDSGGDIPAPGRQENRLLRALPAQEAARLDPHLESVPLAAMQVLTEAGQWLSHVYFPETAVIAFLRRTRDGMAIGAGTVGRDGMSGLSALEGISWSPTAIVTPVPGRSWRMSAARLREMLPELPTLDSLIGRYALVFIDGLGQTIVCNGLHSVEQRCARWLLGVHDRVGGDSFQMTHGILAELLGVRRAGVTVAALEFQREGFITYSRGHVTILDRRGLETSACECHAVLRANAQRLMGNEADR